MNNLIFVVIIVNFNSYIECEKAIHSITQYTSDSRYKICIYDNASRDSKRISNLEKMDSHVITVRGEHNLGYAKGNNEAIKFILKRYNVDYIFIMNPDVEILEQGTLENLIKSIETKNDDTIVGGQPLIWTPLYGTDATIQTNIRKIDNLFDLFVLFLSPNRLIFRKTWDKINYIKQRPYKLEIKYLIPSGSFFFIRSDVFETVGLFDERTFLYNEELILGEKLKKIKKNLLLMPEYVVKHTHSASIGSTKYNIKWNAYKHEIQSRKILLQYYTNNKWIVNGMKIISIFDFMLKKIGGVIYRTFKLMIYQHE